MNKTTDENRSRSSQPGSTASLTLPIKPEVVAIQLEEQLHALDDFRYKGRCKGRISIGRSPNCDIVLHDETVSAVHCYLRRKKHRLFLQEYESHNKLLVNSVRVQSGSVELHPGMVITIGSQSLHMCGRDSGKQLHIYANTLADFVEKAVSRTGGNVTKAARLIGMPSSTLHDWIDSARFGIRM